MKLTELKETLAVTVGGMTPSDTPVYFETPSGEILPVDSARVDKTGSQPRVILSAETPHD